MCQSAAVCEAEVVVLGAAVRMKALRSSGVSQPRIACRSWKWVSKVSRRRYDRVLGGDARNYSQELTKTLMAGDAAWGAGGLYFSSWDAGDGSYESYYDVDQGLGT